MVAPPKTPAATTGDDDGRETEDRDAILGRRARFIATALSALAIGTASVPGCDSEVTRERSGGGGGGDQGGGGAPQPCLDVAAPDAASNGSSTGEGGAPQPCLGMPAQGGGGMGGTDGSGGDGGAGGVDGSGGGFGGGGGALPCLAPEIRSRR